MKKLITIPLFLLTMSSFSQVVSGYFDNGQPGKKVTLHGLGTSSTYFLLPNDSTWNFDSSKVVTDISLNITSDSIYIYKGGLFVRAIKLGTSGGGGGGSAAGPSDAVQINVNNAFTGYSTFTFNPVQSALSGLARSLLIAPGALTAVTNYDTLIGVDIKSPTFVPGLNTNIKQFALRVNGSVNLTGAYTPSQNSLTDYSGLFLNRRLTNGLGNLKGVNIVDTLVASGNGQELYGVSIVPTFVDGSYTGVTHYALNILGALKLQSINASANVEATGYIYTGTAFRIGSTTGIGKINITQDASTYDQFIRFDNTEAGNVRSWIISPANGSLGALVIKDKTVDIERFRISSNGNIMINTQTDVANKILNIVSTTKASHPFPSMTSAQRTAMTMTAANIGDHVYQTDGTEGVYVYKSTGWQIAYQ